MPWFGGSATNGWVTSSIATCGQGSLYYNTVQTAGTACTTQTFAWVTNTATTTTNAWYDPAQEAYFYNNQRIDRQQVADWYNNQAQVQCANAQAQQYLQLRISDAELRRRAKQREQSAYEKAIAEHNDQEVARLRRLIDARAEREADQARRDEELRTEREQREAERRIEYEAEQVRKRAAELRARELLIEHLSEEQRDTFQTNQWFIIEGGRSKQKYRIRADASLVANIDVLGDSGHRIHRLCAHARSGSVPLGDQLLAQKITLENDEDAFLRIANRHAA